MNDLRRPVDKIAPPEHGGVEMSADFAVFIRKSVKELIEETLAKIGL